MHTYAVCSSLSPPLFSSSLFLLSFPPLFSSSLSVRFSPQDISQTRCCIPLTVQAPLLASDDYVGLQFGVKHAVVVTIKRPWYTFPVVSHHPVCIYTPEPAPTESIGHDHLNEDERNSAVQEEISEQYLAGGVGGEVDEDAIRAK